MNINCFEKNHWSIWMAAACLVLLLNVQLQGKKLGG